MRQNIGKAMTVCGPISPEELGKTLPHEHTLTYLTYYARKSEDPEIAEQFLKPVTLENLSMVLDDFYCVQDNCLIQDIPFLVREMKRFAQAGGGTICDLTTEDITQFKDQNDVHWRNIRELSEQSGVNIICGVGSYLSDVHLERDRNMTDEQLAEHYIRIIRDGYGTSGVRPGIIGEQGVGNELDAEEQKGLRAAAIASAETGLPINIHINVCSWEHDFTVLNILEEAGADLNRVVISHREAALIVPGWTEEDALGHLMGIMDRGAYVEFDGCGNNHMETAPYGSWTNPSDAERCRALYKLINRGYGKRLLLSMDASQRHRYSSYGGYCFNHILKRFREIALLNGIREEDYWRMVIDNNRDVFTIR